MRFPATSSFGIKPISVEGTTRLVKAAIEYALDQKVRWSLCVCECECAARVFACFRPVLMTLMSLSLFLCECERKC